jgi:2-methylcitrate dehydratase PrpD
MSIQFCVGAALTRGVIEEANYRALEQPEINRLARLTKIEVDPALTAAYPAKQGAEVIVTLRDGRVLRHALTDVVPATPEQIRARFRSAAEKILGKEKTHAIEMYILALELNQMGRLAEMLGTGESVG